jgi:Ribonuclease G/E
VEQPYAAQKGWYKPDGMKKEIIINAGANETRIAITEDGRLAELFVETANKEKMVGDIYFGKIAKVMPGIKAAFIDIGLGQDGFLISRTSATGSRNTAP